MIAIRDTPSEKKLTKMMTRSSTRDKRKYRSNVVMGGDIAFSYPYDPNSESYAQNLEKMKETLDVVKAMNQDWTLVFTKESNFGKDKGIVIKGSKVIITALDGQVLKLDVGKLTFFPPSHQRPSLS
jgi:hypothetical protein